jgi:hypothetical protein
MTATRDDVFLASVLMRAPRSVVSINPQNALNKTTPQKEYIGVNLRRLLTT